METNDTRPLAGVKVLELAQIMAGPTCGMMLADLGADVIKVEKLPHGDDSRLYTGAGGQALPAPFVMLNRNKRGMAVNLKLPAGRDVLQRMVQGSDVFLENYRKGTMDKLGLGWEALSAINPALVYCSISGYGRTGPYADKGGFDLIAQAYAGLMSVTGEKDGPPLKPGNSVADINAGVMAVVGVLSALLHRARSGRGQFVETSLIEVSLQQMYWFASMFFQTGKVPGASGSAHPLTAPYQAFRTRDSWLVLGGANQANWERIADLLGHPEWKSDPRFVTNADRKANEAELAAAISLELANDDTANWVARFDGAGIPAGPVHNIEQALNHPQTQARDMVIKVEHPIAGTGHSLALPVKLSATPARVTHPAPLLGENTREILREYAFRDDEIDDLVRQGAVAEHASPCMA
ncbi:CaiB/BaiF CoA transferase family protein [Bordetella genomosp. 12]|uniref:CoA transferase n=1 Tax=Bordetella genomosp. 12 TaxID=463035 RepID=A0A261VDE9_9BORD|nr:CaiB/BaiF CoA-transferase family protein [Bordetella genomosp. 12]OZI71867.1 CoA transferase [Bordetella genomosp. 12]